MNRKLITVALLATLLFSAVLAPVSVVSAQSGVTVPITGTVGDGGTFEGVFEITQFAAQGGQLVAQGLLDGVLTDATGAAIGTVTDVAVSFPINASGTCQILHLELGPLDLNLLGLMVHLDQVVLDITADQGGGLLGGLLCAIANLLDNGVPLNPIVRLLNRILDILQ